MDTTTAETPRADGAAGTRVPAATAALPAGRTLARGLTLAYACSLIVAALIAVVSAGGLAGDPAARYGASSSVLVSRGADAANLALVLPTLLATPWLVLRGSLAGLPLWPGALFYATYAYLPYLVGAPFSAPVFGYVALVTLGAFTCIGLLASVERTAVRARLARAPARGFGGALVVVAALAYAGLLVTAVGALAGAPGDPAWRGH